MGCARARFSIKKFATAKSEAELESQITEHTVALRYQKITSPVDGVVFELLPGGAGT